MSLQFLCGLMVFVLLASNIGSAEDVVNNEGNTGTDGKGSEDSQESSGLAASFALAGGKLEYVMAIMAGQIMKLNLEVETLKNAIQKYTGVEPAPEPGSKIELEGQEPGLEPGSESGSEPGSQPEPGTFGGRSTLERLKKLLAERKLSDQKESKINALRRMLESLQ